MSNTDHVARRILIPLALGLLLSMIVPINVAVASDEPRPVGAPGASSHLEVIIVCRPPTWDQPVPAAPFSVPAGWGQQPRRKLPAWADPRAAFTSRFPTPGLPRPRLPGTAELPYSAFPYGFVSGGCRPEIVRVGNAR
jgi:hypothetical protein